MSDSGQTPKYPSKEEIQRFVNSVDPTDDPDYYTAQIVHKACDWQREQDALICEGKAADEKWPASGAVRNCASAIRSGGSHD